MKDMVRIELQPLGESFEVERGSPLQDHLFARGVEFPCGGKGICRGCRIRVLAGDIPVTPIERKQLSAAEIAAGWRLACCTSAWSDLVLEIGQWEGAVLTDSSPLRVRPQEGVAVAVDLGTTTIACQLVDLRDGSVLGVETGWNPQARHGADIMSRVEFSVRGGKQKILEESIRECVGRMVLRLLESASAPLPPLRRIVIVGNTVMHHLFCGIDLTPLAGVPFEPVQDGLEILPASSLGWPLAGDPEVRFLPCLGGFVGSDILAGILATGMHERRSITALLDLGTNGEIAIGSREGIVCASTAAGPAFEGARISRGMRAASGAISRVLREGDGWTCHVIGGGSPAGICGSGLVDAIAVGLEIGRIEPSGRIAGGAAQWPLAPPVTITQGDVRELQLAKGAMAAGVRVLLEGMGLAIQDVRRVQLAGAFGNYVDPESARRIGLVLFPAGRIEPAGNTALHGAKIALFAGDAAESGYAELASSVRHVSLASDPRFQDLYVEAMLFQRPAESPAP